MGFKLGCLVIRNLMGLWSWKVILEDICLFRILRMELIFKSRILLYRSFLCYKGRLSRKSGIKWLLGSTFSLNSTVFLCQKIPIKFWSSNHSIFLLRSSASIEMESMSATLQFLAIWVSLVFSTMRLIVPSRIYMDFSGKRSSLL